MSAVHVLSSIRPHANVGGWLMQPPSILLVLLLLFVLSLSILTIIVDSLLLWSVNRAILKLAGGCSVIGSALGQLRKPETRPKDG